MRRAIPLWSETLAAAALGALVVAIVASFLSGCGGDAFSARLDAPAADVVDGAPLEVLEDAATGRDNHAPLADRPVLAADAGDADAMQPNAVHDAGGDVLEVLEASRFDTAPELDAGGDVLEVLDVSADAADAGTQVPEAAPPALCCDTPCGGGQVAAITCGNGPPWTCGDPSGPSCSAARCSIGALCYWQGASCSGRVEVCP